MSNVVTMAMRNRYEVCLHILNPMNTDWVVRCQEGINDDLISTRVYVERGMSQESDFDVHISSNVRFPCPPVFGSHGL